jgi:hypothetical protein
MGTAFFNYSHFGEAPFGQLLRARHVLRDKPSVRAIVIQLDSYVIEDQRSYRPIPGSRGFYEYLLFSPLSDIEAVVHPSAHELARNFEAFYFPLVLWWERTDFWGAVRQALTRIGMDDSPPPSRYFNSCGDLVNRAGHGWNAANDAGRAQAARDQALVRYENRIVDVEIIEILRAFVADATAQGIKVIGIRMPETREFREASRMLVDPTADRIADVLGVPLLDYRELLLDRPELFADADHLTDAGAAILSRMVALDLDNIANIPRQNVWDCSSEPLAQTQHIRPYEVPLQAIVHLLSFAGR